MPVRFFVRRRAVLITVSSLILIGTMATPAVAAPDFQITISPPSQTIEPGQSRSFAVGVGPIEGFSNDVTLSLSSDGPGGTLPAGVTWNFSPNPVTPPGTSLLTITAAQDVQSGTSFSVIVTGTGGGISNTATGQATVDFGLPPVCYGAVEGIVTDAETGDPLAGALVSSIPTDDAGHYRVEMPLAEGNLPMQTFVQATKEPTYWHADAYPVEVRCEETTSLDFALVPVHPARLSGRVVEGTVVPPNFTDVIPTSTPIEGATVNLGNWFFPAGSQTTAADGSFDLGPFRVGRDNEPVDLFLHADKFRGAPDRDGYWLNIVGFHAEAGDDLVQEIALVKECTASISGRVVFAGSNLPASDVSVTAGLSNVDFDRVSTDEEGRFSFPELLLNPNNAPATYLVAAGLGDNPFRSAPLDECGDHADVELAIRLEQKGSIEGRVIDEDTGLPVEGAYVGFGNTFVTSCPAECVYTDAEGRYLLEGVGVGFDGTPLETAVTAQKDDYWGPLSGTVVTVRANETSTADDILLLRRRYADITGIVRDSITHVPIEGISVFDEFHGSGSDYSDLTDQDGRYTLEDVQLGTRNAPRDVVVVANAFPGASGYWQAKATVGVQADQTSAQDFELIPVCENATISGRVVDADTQEPIERASVFGGGYRDETNANGEYRLEDVTVGNDNSPLQLVLTAAATGYHTQTKTVTIFCDASVELNFGQPSAGVEGYVTDVTEGTPGIPMAGVLITSGAGGAVTDGNGFYRLANVPLGPNGSPRAWTLSAEPDGFVAQSKEVTVHAGETARLDFAFSDEPPGTGSLSVRKTLDAGGATMGLPASYTVHYDCGLGRTGDVSVVAGGGATLVDGSVPFGTSCTVSEPSLSDAPPGYTFGAPTFSPSATVTIDQDAPSVTVTTNNSLTRDTGSLHITKLVAGGGVGFSGSFDVHVVCTGDGGTYNRTIVYPTPGDVMISGIPTGNTCTVSETTQSSPPPGYTWGTTTIAGSPTAAINVLTPRDISVTNTVTGRAKVVKTKGGLPLAGTDSFTFQLRQGANMTNLGTILQAQDATTANGGVINFTTVLVPAQHYQACELVMPGWNTSLQGTLFVPGSVIPPALPNPDVDNSPVCVDFVAQAGVTTTFNVDNTSPGGLARTIGFWKNWASCAKSSGKQKPVLDQTLAKAEPTGTVVSAQSGTYPGFTPTLYLILHGSTTRPNAAPDCSRAVNLLNKATMITGKKMASDPAFNLVAQLIAAELNFTAGAAKNGAVITAVNQAVVLLGKYHFDGTTHTRISAADTSTMNTLAKTLDNYNNNRP